MIISGSGDQSELARQRTILAVERNRLAAQRTFNAWLRTGLSGVGGGIAVIKFIPFADPMHRFTADLIGQFLIVWGIAIFIYAMYSYIQISRQLTGLGESKSNYIAIVLITFSLIAVSIALFAITSVSSHPEQWPASFPSE